jgi:hypothetical protein
MDSEVQFPVTIRFEDGEVEEFQSREELVCNLEDFDSETDDDCEVRDGVGRRVLLKVSLLEIKRLSIIDDTGS